MLIQPMGKVARRGNRYCGAGCGRGCTWVEYHYAVAAADALATRMGPEWIPVVWENLGWHARVKYKHAELTVRRHRAGEYWVDLHLCGRQFCATGNTAKSALRLVINGCRNQIAQEQCAIKLLEGL